MPEENKNKQSFIQSKLFAVLVSIIATAIVMVIIGILILPVIAASGENGANDGEDENLDTTLAINKLDYDPTGKSGYNITFVFNQDVVKENEIGKKKDVQYFKFKPEIPENGVFVWESSYRLTFKPNSALLPSTKYEAVMNKSAFSSWKGDITNKTKYEIETVRFKVASVSGNTIKDLEDRNTLQYKYNIFFNLPVLPDDVKENTKILLDNNEIGYEIDKESIPEGSKAVSQISLITDKFERTDDVQYLYLTISKELKGLNCELGLESDFKETTRIDKKENLNIYDIAVYSRSDDKQYIKLSLNHQVDVDQIKPYLSVSPDVDFKLSGGNYYLDIDADFEIGSIYTITLSKGYEAIYGATVKETITREVYVGDVEPNIDLEYPTLDFTAPGIYLPKEKTQQISLNTINVDKVEVDVYRIFANNVVYFLQDAYYDYDYYWDSSYRVGKKLYSEDIDVKNSPNMRIYTDVNLSKVLSENEKGIYRLKVRDTDDRWRKTSKWLIATDLGIVAKKSGKDLMVWVNSLKNLNPVPGTKITLYSYTNQPIVQGETDNNGVFTFRNLDAKLQDFNPFAIVAETEDDFSFIKLNETKNSTVDFDTGGSYMPDSGIEAFLYMDRNIFRPGDKANLVSVVRSTNQTDVEPMPVKLKIKNPKNQVLHELVGNLDSEAVAEFNFDIPTYSITGYYNAELIMGEDKVIGRYSFQVEDFIPATIKVDVNLDKDSYKPGEQIKATVNGMSLFGPPAANKKVQAKYTLSSTSLSVPEYRSYTFGDYNNKSFSSYTNSLGEFKLNSEGNYEYTINIDSNMTPPSILKATVQASVFDTGGRAVTQRASTNIYPYDYYVGVKRLSDYYVQTNMPVPFEYVILNKDGEEVEIDQINVKVEKAYYVNILKKDSDGKLRYVSEKRQDIVQELTLNKDAMDEPYRYIAKDNGSYTVTFTVPEDNSSTSIKFYAYGWGGDSFSLSDPDKLLLELDKESYNVGDKAKVIVKSPFAGKLLLTVERDRVLFNTIVELENNTADIPLNIAKEFGPNAYISGTIIRSIDYVEPFTPVRAFGIVPLKVDNPSTNIEVTANAPEKMEPNNPIKIELSLKNTKLDSTRVTVAAVDEGILQLTNYQNPDPHGFFYRKRALEMETFDLYNFIIPDEEKVKLLYSNPGGAEGKSAADYMQKTQTKRVKPTSLWSGIKKLDSQGKVTVELDVPEFNGTLRIMAVAVDDNAYGSASTQTLVRAPIVLNPTFPRFLAMGDKYVIPVGVNNFTGKDGEFTVKLSDNGFVDYENPTQKVFVRADKEEIIYFNVTSKKKVGDVYFTLTGEGNGKTVEKKVEMPQRSYRTLMSDVKSGSVKAGSPVNLNKIAEGWIPEATEYNLMVSSLPTVKFANSLKYLLRYPHGCCEQTTSKVLPLLYFNDLVSSAEPKLVKDKSAAFFVERGIRKLEAMQLNDGSIAYWPNGNYSNDWSSIYACHFLIEAKKAGYQVSENVIRNLIKWLKNLVNSAYVSNYSDYDHGVHYNDLGRKAYAHYVLALAGEPQLGGMFYIKNNLLGDLSIQARYLLMGALALSGQTDLGKELMVQKYEVPDVEKQTGGNFNSTVRTLAIMLNVLAEVDSNNPMIPSIIKDIEERAYLGRWYTTQETAFALLALGKVFSKKENENYTVKITDNRLGQLGTYSTGEKPLNIELGEDSDVTLSLDGNGEAYYTLTIFGIPDKDVEPYDKGILIRRTYLDANEKPVNLSDVKVGQLIVAKVRIRANKSMDNVAIVDLLPAGLEIENPRLDSTESIPWAVSSYSSQYMDMRDDRLLLYSGVGDYDRTFYYTVRAVTEGEFNIPMIMAEAMYNPDYSSISSGGKLIINK